MPFKFRLDAVLTLRKFREQTAQKDLAAARADRTRQEAVIDGLAGQRAETARICGDAVASGMTAARYFLFKTHINGIDTRLDQAHRHLASIDKTVARKQKALKQACVEKKILETMRDKQEEQYKRTAEKAEQNQLDELVLLRSRRSL